MAERISKKVSHKQLFVTLICILIFVCSIVLAFHVLNKIELYGRSYYSYVGVSVMVFYEEVYVHEDNITALLKSSNVTNVTISNPHYSCSDGKFNPYWKFDIINLTTGEFDGKRRGCIYAKDNSAILRNLTIHLTYLSDNRSDYGGKAQIDEKTYQQYQSEKVAFIEYVDLICGVFENVTKKNPDSVVYDRYYKMVCT